MNEREMEERFRIWLLDVYGGVLLLYLYCNFFKQCNIEGIEGLISLFVVSLSKYVLEKKKSKKQEIHTRKRKGELWVGVWVVSCFFMIFTNHFFPNNFNLPTNEIVYLLTSVCGLSFIGKVKT